MSSSMIDYSSLDPSFLLKGGPGDYGMHTLQTSYGNITYEFDINLCCRSKILLENIFRDM